jgi:hypothetical protein
VSQALPKRQEQQMASLKTHLIQRSGDRIVACDLVDRAWSQEHTVQITDDPAAVTCQACRKTLAFRAAASS